MQPVRIFSGRDTIVFNTFDVDHGYENVYQQALRRAPRSPQTRCEPLLQNGYAVVPCMTADAAQALREQLFDDADACRFRSLSFEAMEQVCTTLLTPAVDDTIVSRFGTDYLVLFGDGHATHYNPDGSHRDANISSYWHCDGGPHYHLKLILYLDDAASHDGATVVLSRSETDVFKSSGYVFCPLEERVADLDAATRRYHLTHTPKPVRVAPNAGDALIFEPTNVLHRAALPTFGPRRTFTLGFAPFPAPWQSTLPGMYPNICANHDFSFINLLKL